MILDAIDQDRLTIDLMQDPRHVGIKARAKFDIFEEGCSVLGAESYMEYDAGEGLRHGLGRLSRPLGALHGYGLTWGDARFLALPQAGLFLGRWPKGEVSARKLAKRQDTRSVRAGKPLLKISD